MDKYNTINRFSEIIKTNSIDMKQTIAENLLNKEKHHLSASAKKRLKWMYIIHYECDGNIKMVANKIGVSRLGFPSFTRIGKSIIAILVRLNQNPELRITQKTEKEFLKK